MQAIVFSWMMMLGMLHGAGTNFPVDMFQTTSHNFGTVVKGTKTEFDFEFTNIFVEDVVIESVTSSCQCTTPSFGPRGPIKTGQKGKIHISVNTQNFTGTKNATITVRFARPYRAEMQLHSYVYIRSDVSVNPGIVYFGSVDPKTRPAVPVNINSVNQGWQIRDVQSECNFLSVELKKHPNYASSYTMVVRLKENAPPGPFSEILEVITNDYDPRSQRVPVRVQGRVKQTLSASPSPLAFNIVEEGGAAEKTLVIQGAEPFRITDITSESRNISASIEHDARKIHPIKLTYHGKNVGDFTGGITVFTDLEGGMSTQVQFSGRVIPAPEEEPAPKMDAVPENEAAPEIDAAPKNEAAPETDVLPETDADPGLAPLPSPNEEEETNDADAQKEEPSEPALDGLLNLEETSDENDAEAPKKKALPAAEDKKAADAESLDGALDASLTDENQEAPKQEKETDGVELLDLPDLEDEKIVPETKEAEGTEKEDGTEKADAENADDSDDAETSTDSKETDEEKVGELPESLNFQSKPGLADEAPKRNAPLSLDDLIEESTSNDAEETPKAEETDEILPADDVLPENNAVPAEKKEETDANAGVETLDDGLGIDLSNDEEEENAEQETPDALPLDAKLPESDAPAANEEELPAILDDASSKEVNEDLDDPAPLDGLDELPDEGPAETENAENETPEIKKVKAPADEIKAPANEEIPAEDADETKDAAPQTVDEPDDLSALFADPGSQDSAAGPSVSETSEIRPNESVQPIGRNLLKRKI